MLIVNSSLSNSFTKKIVFDTPTNVSNGSTLTLSESILDYDALEIITTPNSASDRGSTVNMMIVNDGRCQVTQCSDKANMNISDDGTKLICDYSSTAIGIRRIYAVK